MPRRGRGGWCRAGTRPRALARPPACAAQAATALSLRVEGVDELDTIGLHAAAVGAGAPSRARARRRRPSARRRCGARRCSRRRRRNASASSALARRTLDQFVRSCRRARARSRPRQHEDALRDPGAAAPRWRAVRADEWPRGSAPSHGSRGRCVCTRAGLAGSKPAAAT